MRHRLCIMSSLMLMLLSVMLIPSLSKVEAEFRTESVILTVYQDGLVHVTQVADVNETISEITLLLLSSSVSNLLVVDENESILYYDTAGSNITVFTLGAIKITLDYDTISLTSMEAGVWTISLETPYNVTLRLPEDADVIFLSDVPTSIDTEGDRIILHLFPGRWEISYILPITPPMNFKITDLKISPAEVNPNENVTVSVLVMNIGRKTDSYTVVLKINGTVERVKTITLNEGNSTEVSFKISKSNPGTYNVEIAGLKGKFKIQKPPPPSYPFPIEYAVFPLVIIMAAVIFLFTRRRKTPNVEKIFESHPYLRQEERDVLTFLAENGGKAFESEIRKRFPDIPRTSLWRLVRRLEKEEIVEIRRVGLGNIVELKKG